MLRCTRSSIRVCQSRRSSASHFAHRIGSIVSDVSRDPRAVPSTERDRRDAADIALFGPRRSWCHHINISVCRQSTANGRSARPAAF
eukprot:7386329-Prymnesium_polylepis.1